MPLPIYGPLRAGFVPWSGVKAQAQNQALDQPNVDLQTVEAMAQQAPVPMAPPQQAPAQPQGASFDDLKAAMGGQTPTSASYTQKFINPESGEFQAQAQAARDEYETARQKYEGIGQAGIDDMSNAINQYESQKRGIDFRPLAALLDQWSGGGNLSELAQATAPESIEAKQEKVLAMKRQLQDAKGSLSKEQLNAMKERLDSYNDALKNLMSERRLAASLAGKGDTQDRLNRNDIEKQVEKISTRLGSANSVLITQKLNRLNQHIPGGVFGKGDISGIGVGLRWTPQFLLSDAGSEIRQDAQALLVESIKAATGLSQTEAEMKAQEQINGMSKSNTVNQFRQALRKQVEDNLAKAGEIIKTYRPEAQAMYRERQGGKTVADVLSEVKSGGKKAPGKNLDEMSNEELEAYINANGG